MMQPRNTAKIHPPSDADRRPMLLHAERLVGAARHWGDNPV